MDAEETAGVFARVQVMLGGVLGKRDTVHEEHACEQDRKPDGGVPFAGCRQDAARLLCAPLRHREAAGQGVHLRTKGNRVILRCYNIAIQASMSPFDPRGVDTPACRYTHSCSQGSPLAAKICPPVPPSGDRPQTVPAACQRSHLRRDLIVPGLAHTGQAQ